MPPPGEIDLAAIALALGQNTGEVKAMHEATSKALDLIRSDIHRMENNHREQMTTLEERLTRNMEKVSERVTKLEADARAQAIDSAKQGVITGGLAGSLTYLAIEFIKKIGHF